MDEVKQGAMVRRIINTLRSYGLTNEEIDIVLTATQQEIEIEGKSSA